MPFDPSKPPGPNNHGDDTMFIGDQAYVWQPDTSAAETAQYLGQDAPEIDPTPGVGPGSWVPASYAHPNGQAGKILGLLALAGGGGGLAAGALSGGLAAGGAAAASGGAAGATGASAALPAAVSGLTGAGGAAAGAGTAAATGGGILGTLGTIGKVAGTVGTVAGNVAAARAKGRADAAVIGQNADRTALDAARNEETAIENRANIDLDQRKFAQSAPSVRAGQTAYGDILANLHNLNVSVPGITNATITGGMMPDSVLGPNSRAAGAELSKQALAALLEKSDSTFPTLPAIKTPTATPLPTPGKSDSILSALGTYGSLLGGINTFIPKPRPVTG